jgi:hypothetical protein
VKLGSCDSSRIARPGRFMAPRFGLLLGLLAATVGSVVGCVDQTLIPVERPATGGGGGASSIGGGGSNATSGPHNGGSGNVSGTGGWFGSGGNGPNGNGGAATGGAGGTCGAVGAKCSDSRECCSKNCVDGECANVASGCIAADYSTHCPGDGSCCSRNCDGTLDVCVEIEGCKPVGELCSKWWDCCSGDCVPQGSGWGRCQPGGSATCESAGEICENEGVQDTCCENLTCRRSVEGIKRCALRDTRDCTSPPEPCRVASDCCAVDASETAGHCIFSKAAAASAIQPEGRYYGTCQACGDTGQPCKVNVDCCADMGFACNLTTRTCELVATSSASKSGMP